MLRRELFSERVGETLEARAGGEAEAVGLRIDRVEGFGATDGARFSVFFSGPGERSLQQGIHRVSLADGEPFDLFLVPIGIEGSRCLYEAAFNREGV